MTRSKAEGSWYADNSRDSLTQDSVAFSFLIFFESSRSTLSITFNDGIEWVRLTLRTEDMKAKLSTIATFPIIHHNSDLTAAIIDTRTAIINHRKINIYQFYVEIHI